MGKTKYINANELRAMMYHGAFEEDSGLQRWDGGCWIRYKMFENALEQIEAADVAPQWIPVAEGLPEEDGRYLITGKRGTVYSIEYEDGRWYGGIQPIAWMPFPPPYKGGEEE